LVGPRTRRLSLGAESAVRNPTLYFLQAPVAPRHRQQDCPKRGPEWISQSKREEKKKIPTAPCRAAEMAAMRLEENKTVNPVEAT